METSLKSKVLYSDLITELIKSGNVLAIYEGGSRFYNLDSSESDYDIIIISKPSSLLNYNNTAVHLQGYNMHLAISPIDTILANIKEPLKIKGFKSNKSLLEILHLQDEHLLYSSSTFKSFLTIMNKYNKQLTILALENLLTTIYNRISFPIKHYEKKLYHYMVKYYLLQNYLISEDFYLTVEQQKLISTIKENRLISHELVSILNNASSL